MRGVLITVSVVFLGGFLAMTIYAAIDRGFTILSVTSLFVIVLMGIGILGAIWQRFDDE